jgi:hypothetical protein
VLATCTNVATSACVALGASTDIKIAAKTTQPTYTEILFTIFIFLPFLDFEIGRKILRRYAA